MDARSPFFEGVVYKSFALQKTKKVLRLEGSKLTYRKDDDEEGPEGLMRLTASSTVSATTNHYRKRQGFKVKTGRKTWHFEVRQLDKHQQLWIQEIQETIDRLKARELADDKEFRKPPKPSKPLRPTAAVVVDGVTYNLLQRKTKNVSVDTKNWGRLTFALDDRYRKQDYLGEGSYGVVVSAEDTTDKDAKVAVKGVIGLFSGSNSHLDPIRKIAREVRISRQVDHPHVIKLIDAYVPPTPEFDHVYLLFEHMHLSLWKVAYGKYELSPVQIQWLMYQLVCGVHYLHSLGVMHRDLAPTNILVNKTLELKICDLGFARSTAVLGPSDVGLSREAVTQYWRAPEVELSVGGYTKAIDMWAVGVIFADMLAKKPILYAKTVKDLLTKQVALLGKPDDETIERMSTTNYNRQMKHFLQRLEAPAETYDFGKLFPSPQNEHDKALWAAGLDLLKNLLVFDPEKRLTAAEAMAHPFFDEHIPGFGPRTPEAEKPAEARAEWGDIDSDQFTTLDTASRVACRRWILEDLVALHKDAPPDPGEESDEETITTYEDPTTEEGSEQESEDRGITGAGKVALRRAATLGTLGNRGEDRAQGAADEKQKITASLWSFLGYLIS